MAVSVLGLAAIIGKGDPSTLSSLPLSLPMASAFTVPTIIARCSPSSSSASAYFSRPCNRRHRGAFRATDTKATAPNSRAYTRAGSPSLTMSTSSSSSSSNDATTTAAAQSSENKPDIIGNVEIDLELCEPAPEILANDSTGQLDPRLLLGGALVLFGGAGAVVAAANGVSMSDASNFVQNLMHDPQATLQSVVDTVEQMGPQGALYFAILYLVAEVLAVPATPLNLSAGYLFGWGKGTLVCLIPAVIAASFAFFIGKTVLRCWVEELLEQNPDFRKIDKAVGQEGFKLLLLVRLSPLFPFALSNYLYGASSIKFFDYFWGTFFGFLPGTMAYVYTGMVGQALTLDNGGGHQPWYVYAGGFCAILTFLKLVTDVATNIVNAIDDDDVDESSDGNDVNADGVAASNSSTGSFF